MIVQVRLDRLHGLRVELARGARRAPSRGPRPRRRTSGRCRRPPLVLTCCTSLPRSRSAAALSDMPAPRDAWPPTRRRPRARRADSPAATSCGHDSVIPPPDAPPPRRARASGRRARATSRWRPRCARRRRRAPRCRARGPSGGAISGNARACARDALAAPSSVPRHAAHVTRCASSSACSSVDSVAVDGRRRAGRSRDR